MTLLIYPLLAYFLGSIPNALWITRLVKGIDVRDGGSGHVTTTNTIRQAGWLPGVVVFILDVTKGFVPTYLALLADSPDWILALTVALAVTGHCWPIFAQFRGGMGLATTGGALLALEPVTFLICLAMLVAIMLLIRHSARAALATGLLAPVVFYLIGLRGTIIWVGIAAGIVIAIRFTIDWNREYRELWLDREN
jgi:acyl phosphate:glycerol-3-phosphate acyltransferase